MNIPYETTKVPVERSLAGISSFLDRVGFTSSATINENSRRRIIAKIDGIAFEWAADIPGIQKAYGEAHGGRYLREDQAGRIAWRAIYYREASQADDSPASGSGGGRVMNKQKVLICKNGIEIIWTYAARDNRLEVTYDMFELIRRGLVTKFDLEVEKVIEEEVK